MTRFDLVFKARPVVHVESLDQALRNAEIAHGAGCDGVFLINHLGGHSDLLVIHHAVSAEFPGWWIGLNCLDLAPWQVFGLIGIEVDGVWVDNAGIDERAETQVTAELIAEARNESGWPGLYFGGVAFKYQRPVADLERAAILATRYMDVVTTSGRGTGQSAHVDKIQTMKQAIGDFPLAIASGITPENINRYLGIADCFLVATGISKSWSELAPDRVGDLVRRARSG